MNKENKNTSESNDATYVKKPEIHYSYKFQPYVRDLGGSPGKNMTQEDRNKRLRFENNVNAVRNVVRGLNNTFGTAISGASLFYGGGWALNRLLHLNKASNLGQFFGKYALPANMADNVSDGVELIFDPSVKGAVDLGTGVVLGKFKDLSKPVRQVGELVGLGANVNNMKNGGQVRKMLTAAGGPIYSTIEKSDNTRVSYNPIIEMSKRKGLIGTLAGILLLTEHDEAQEKRKLEEANQKRLKRRKELEDKVNAQKKHSLSSSSLINAANDLQYMDTPEGQELAKINREDEANESAYIASLPWWKKGMFYANKLVNAGFIPVSGGTTGMAAAKTPQQTLSGFISKFGEPGNLERTVNNIILENEHWLPKETGMFAQKHSSVGSSYRKIFEELWGKENTDRLTDDLLGKLILIRNHLIDTNIPLKGDFVYVVDGQAKAYRNGLEIGYLSNSYINNGKALHPEMVKKQGTNNAGVSELLYNGTILAENRPIISGSRLLMPEVTTHIWSKYPTRKLISTEGIHAWPLRTAQERGIKLNYEKNWHTLPEFSKLHQLALDENIRTNLIGLPIYELSEPSYLPMVKNARVFDISLLRDGYINLDFTPGFAYKQGGKMNILELFKRGGQIRKMLTASGGPIVKLPGKSQKEVDETNNYNRNKAKGLFKGMISGEVLPTMSNIGSMLGAAYSGWLDPETTNITGEAPNPGMRNPRQAINIVKKTPSIILSYKKVVPRFIKKVKEFNGANKILRTISAASKLISPTYTKTLAKSPELVDLIPLWGFKNFNTKLLQNFLKVWETEAAKGPYSLKGLLQYDNSPDKIRNLSKHFEEARKLQRGIDLGGRYGRLVSRKYQQMYDLITDPNLKHIADTSPLYIPELFLLLKNFGGASEDFLKELIKRSNSYRRYMTKPGTAEDFKTFKGSGLIKGEGSQINVEGKMRSDFNGEYGSYPGYYEGLPNLKGDVSTWWDQRIPLGVDVKLGIWTENPTIVKLRLKGHNYDPNSGSSAIELEFWKNYTAPKKFIDWPTHQVFFGTKGSQLLNFNVTTEMPKNFIFGKGYKQGGKMNIIKLFKEGGQIRKMQTAAGGPINYKRWDDAKITSYTIPYIKEKTIKLTNAGKATGAKLSTNLLDSIADNAYRAGLPIRKGLGIAFKESTFGNPTDDKSAWNLSSKIRELFNNEYPGTYLHINNGHTVLGQHLINYHKGDVNHEIFYKDNPDSHKSIILEAFEFYKQHPDKYNPGLKNYQQLIDKRGNEAMQSPEILKWYKGWEKSKAQIFKSEPYLIAILWNSPEYKEQGGKMNILEFLKKGSGIHIKEKNKGKFTSYCGGKVTDECILKGKNSSNPAIRKRATFAANARKWKHKEGGIIKALGGSKFNWQSIANIGGTLLNTYLLNKKIDSQAKADLAEEKADLSKTFFDLYQEGLKKAALLEQLLIKAAEAMTGTVTNASPISILNNAYRYASAGYGLKKSEQDLKNALIKAQADAEKFDNTTSAVSGLILNGLGMISDYYNNNKSSSSSYNGPSYFSNYVNSYFKNYGTFNPDGSMNMGNGLGTFSIKNGYKFNV